MFKALDSLKMAAAENEFLEAEREFLAITMPLLSSVMASGEYETLYGLVGDNSTGTTHSGIHVHAIPKAGGSIKIRYSSYDQDLTSAHQHDETTYDVIVDTSSMPRVTEVRSLEHSPILHVALEGARTKRVEEQFLPAKALFVEATILRTIAETLT